MKTLTAFDKNLFIKAVKLANKEIFDYINNQISFEDYQYSNTIGFGGDNSLNFDLTAENIFIKHLEKFGNIYSEECGFLNRNSEYTIVIDPLDGSNNFLNNLPYYGTSVALKKNEKVVAPQVQVNINAKRKKRNKTRKQRRHGQERFTPPGKPPTWFPGDGLVAQAWLCRFLSNMLF